jgi:endonuclease YncB( thermonuclease family)
VAGPELEDFTLPMTNSPNSNASPLQRTSRLSALVGIVLMWLVLPAQTQVLTGFASVVDADTIAIGGERIRLQGIDAPEIDQACLDGTGAVWWSGRAAREELIRHIGSDRISCITMGKDIYARWLATCSTAAGDIGEWLVREGLALAFVKYSHVYAADEAAAHGAHKGLWAGAFIAPWDWRWRTASAVILGATRLTQDQERVVRPGADSPWWKVWRP